MSKEILYELKRLLSEKSDRTDDLDADDLKDCLVRVLEASGMVLVPKEPTDRMISEGESGASIGIGRCNDEEALPRVWRMMLNCAPNPFQSK